jgi:hypothetical protein
VAEHRFPLLSSVVEENDVCFIVKDHYGKSLAYDTSPHRG